MRTPRSFISEFTVDRSGFAESANGLIVAIYSVVQYDRMFGDRNGTVTTEEILTGRILLLFASLRRRDPCLGSPERRASTWS